MLTGLANVYWPGRLQMLHSEKTGPAVLVDCAHNVDSATKLAYALTHDYDYRSLWLVLGMTADKDVAGILEVLLPLADGVIMTTSGHPRAAPPSQLARLANQSGMVALIGPTVTAAVKEVWQLAQPDDLICVTGSIFVVGDLLNHWDGLKSELYATGEAVEDEPDAEGQSMRKTWNNQ
jgi:dihydrofolate synthase/folylpolyglutamate synthase